MPLADEILRLTEKHGSPEEKQLLSRWQKELRQFLTPFEREIRLGQQSLEIGLEQGLVLKLIVKRRTLPPMAGLLRMLGQLPDGLRTIARQAAIAEKDFHIGIRLNPGSAHRELYLYDSQGDIRGLLPPTPVLPNNLVVTAYGIDELQGISAYCTIKDNLALSAELQPQREALNTFLKTDLSQWQHSMWLHYRLREGAWNREKFGLEFKDAPLAVTMRVLSEFKLPYFSYLIPRQSLRQMVIGGKTDGRFSAYYFTAL